MAPTAARDLHEGLVKRLRAGEAISTGKIPSHRLATAARRLRKEGIEVVQEKVVLNPGGFPAQVRAVYRVAKPSHSQMNGKAPASQSPSAEIRQRLLDGEELTGNQIYEEYGIHKSNLRQNVEILQKQGYPITARKEDRQIFYRYEEEPVKKARPAKVPKWVREAEQEEANGTTPAVNETVQRGKVTRFMTRQPQRQVPRLLSVVCKTEILSNGEILVTIQDGEDAFEAVLR